MATSLGIVFFLAGISLLVITLFRFLITRSIAMYKFVIVMLFLSLTLVTCGIVAIEKGYNFSNSMIPIGILLVVFGGLMVGIGLWIGLWSPISHRNTRKGIHFLLVGLFISLTGIIFLSSAPYGIIMYISNFNYNYGGGDNKYCANIPFPVIVVILFLFSNGLAVSRRIGFRKVIGTNIICLAFSLLIYHLL